MAPWCKIQKVCINTMNYPLSSGNHCTKFGLFVEGFQNLTYARHLWLLSSEGSLKCHTYCDTGHQFKIVIFEDPWHSRLLLSIQHWSYHYLFLRIRSVTAGIQSPNLPLLGLKSTASTLQPNLVITKQMVHKTRHDLVASNEEVFRLISVQ